MKAGVVLALLLSGCAETSRAPPGTPAPPRLEVSIRGKLWVEHVGGLGVFHGEQIRAMTMLAAWARARGLEVMPVDVSERVTARAAQGRDPITNRACGMALTPDEALTRWHEALGVGGVIAANVACDESRRCTLEVEIFDAVEVDRKRAISLRAPFPYELENDAATEAAFERALRALERYEPAEAEPYGFGRSDAGAGGVQRERMIVTFSPVRASDSADVTEAAGQLESRLHAALRECALIDQSIAVQLETRDGLVARCEPRSSSGGECACRAWHTIDAFVDPELRDRRMYVSSYLVHADVVTPDHHIVDLDTNMYFDRDGSQLWQQSVSDHSIANWQPAPTHMLRGCFASSQGAGRPAIRAEARVTFDRAGAPRRAILTAFSGALSSAEEQCLAKILEDHSRAPCPGVSDPSGDVEIEVRFVRARAD